jgi:putative FmdB family regulatory protein
VPLYEYKCKQCGVVFEVLQKHSVKPLTTHKDCGGPVERLISTSALQFKGSGFYITDYAKGSGAGPKPPGKDSQKAGKSDKSDKQESKPAPPPAKTESAASKPADSKT